MSLITPKTTLETALALTDELLLIAAEAAHHAVQTLRNVHVRFWSQPDEQLMAALNADVTRTLAVFGQNTALGMAANDSLDAVALDRFPGRAPLEMGRADVTFDAELGQFVIVPSASEPNPEP